MKHHKKFMLFLLSIVCFDLHANTAQWTVVIYMEATEFMQDAAIFNSNQILKQGPGEHARVIAYVHNNGNQARVYELKKEEKNFITQVTMSGHTPDNLVRAMELAVTHCPAKKYCFVLWDHGFGVLEPIYNEITGEWEITPDGIAYSPSNGPICDGDVCELKRTRKKKHEHCYHRGMLINAATQTCLTNNDMIEAFTRIKHKVLGGKKLDICGMDLCMGSMIEHGYQLKDYVNFLVGSQDCELIDGWDYEALMKRLSTNIPISARDLAHGIVQDYQNYYKPRAPKGTYTHSALDLSQIDMLKKNIDTVATLLKQLPNKETIKRARKHLTRFCFVPAYADLYEFYESLLQEPHLPGKLQQALHNGCKLIQNFVVANIAGKLRAHVHGVSIYFPSHAVDQSYLSIPFTKDSLWLSFLNNFVE